ncbi:Protein kinase-like domain [Pseudocohnilembus persalinus]|uniref:Protein kinase-like domain n=1 Tax=Pseudocohnilembus persalinus TaxID=266149 RepID=A0A0V0Q8B4_PSEPJ|nr:Protein kinase-like domain [Pseudocohnilembus persalinus]|eukprot:KRW98473.1 Protein kinase-like domain [Pseudocohnilembus persalinus]
MNQFLFPEQEILDKEIKILKNGEKNIKKGIKIFLYKKYQLKDLKAICEKKLFKQQLQSFRLFTDQGVELFEDDLEYIAYDSTLYASNGEDFDPISQFSQYKELKYLGQGGFGKVMLAEHRQTKQKVAIKYIENEQTSANDIDNVFKEAETLKNLKHKNIVEIHQTYTLKNMETVVLVMEYLEGGELLKYLIKKGRLSEQVAREFFVQILDAVSYCHNEKLIHRDLKPENIILSQKGTNQIKIVDFGISSISSNNIKWEKVNIGSLSYMAPEVLSNKVDKIGPPIDIWALGIILYVMVCGHQPFVGSSQKQIANKIVEGKFNFPQDDGLSFQIKNLITSILNINPVHRATIQEIKDHPWMSIDLSQYNIKQLNRQQLKQSILLQHQKSLYRSGAFSLGKSNSQKQVKIQINEIKEEQNNNENQEIKEEKSVKKIKFTPIMRESQFKQKTTEINKVNKYDALNTIQTRNSLPKIINNQNNKINTVIPIKTSKFLQNKKRTFSPLYNNRSFILKESQRQDENKIGIQTQYNKNEFKNGKNMAASLSPPRIRPNQLMNYLEKTSIENKYRILRNSSQKQIQIIN